MNRAYIFRATLCTLSLVISTSLAGSQRESELNDRNTQQQQQSGPVTIVDKREKWGPSHKPGATGNVLYGWWAYYSNGSSAWVPNKGGGNEPRNRDRIRDDAEGSAAGTSGDPTAIRPGSARTGNAAGGGDSSGDGSQRDSGANDSDVRPGSARSGRPGSTDASGSGSNSDDSNVVRPRTRRPRADGSPDSENQLSGADDGTDNPGGANDNRIKGPQERPWVDLGPLEPTARSLTDQKEAYREETLTFNENARRLEVASQKLDDAIGSLSDKEDNLDIQRKNILSRAKADAQANYVCPNGLNWARCDDPNHVHLKQAALDNAESKALNDTGIDQEIAWVRSQKAARQEAQKKLGDRIKENNTAIGQLNKQFEQLNMQIKKYNSGEKWLSPNGKSPVGAPNGP